MKNFAIKRVKYSFKKTLTYAVYIMIIGLYLFKDTGSVEAQVKGPVKQLFLEPFFHRIEGPGWSAAKGSFLFAVTDNGILALHITDFKRRVWEEIEYRGAANCMDAIMVDGQHMEAVGTKIGFFRITNDQATKSNKGLADSSIICVKIISNDVMLAGTKSGLYRTVDGGWNWKNVLNTSINKIVTTSTNLVIVASNSGIFLSTDSGTTWKSANTGLKLVKPNGKTALPEITALEADKLNGNVIYAGTEKWGVFKSTDAGQSWFNTSKGLPGEKQQPSTFQRINCIYSGKKSNVLYTGTRGIFKSTDGGQTWFSYSHVYSPNPIGTITAIVATDVLDTLYDIDLIIGNSNGVLYNPVFSIGKNLPEWRALNFGLTSYSDVKQFVTSNDGKCLWAIINTDPKFSAITVEPSFGLFKSTDQGISWSFINTGLQNYSGSYDISKYGKLIEDPAQSGTLYLAGFHGLRKSTNSGATWFDINNGFERPAHVLDFTIDPNNPKLMYVAVKGFYGGDIEGLYRSDDGGSIWKRLQAGPCAKVLVDPYSSKRILANFGYLSCSTDGGWTWQNVTPRLQDSTITISGKVEYGAQTEIKDVYIYSTPNHSTVLVACCGHITVDYVPKFVNNIMDFSNWGPKWNLLSNSLGKIKFLIGDAKKQEVCCIGDSAELFISKDDGKTWETLVSKGRSSLTLNGATLSKDGNIIYLCTSNSLWFYDVVNRKGWLKFTW